MRWIIKTEKIKQLLKDKLDYLKIAIIVIII